MTRKEALTDLLEKVEAGDATFDALVLEQYGQDLSFAFVNAWRGSRDSAEVLHNAALSGWGYFGGLYVAGDGSLYTVFSPDCSICECGFSLFPARAWLIAILKALITQEDSA